jgi:hypothetical protein
MLANTISLIAERQDSRFAERLSEMMAFMLKKIGLRPVIEPELIERILTGEMIVTTALVADAARRLKIKVPDFSNERDMVSELDIRKLFTEHKFGSAYYALRAVATTDARVLLSGLELQLLTSSRKFLALFNQFHAELAKPFGLEPVNNGGGLGELFKGHAILDSAAVRLAAKNVGIDLPQTGDFS